MRVRGNRRHDRVDVLVGVGDCCGGRSEWIVGGGDTLLSLLFQPKKEKSHVAGPPRREDEKHKPDMTLE
jgi:hypothetical protein